MYEYRIHEIIRVIDGDTLDLRIDLGFGLSSAIRIRLKNIDTAEIYGTEAEPAGQEAKEFAEQWLSDRSGNLLILNTYKGAQSTVGIGDGAFGRWLGEVTDSLNGVGLSDALRQAGYAR